MRLGRYLIVSLRMALVTMAITGILYPLAITGAAHLVFPAKAAGSLVEAGGRVVGSSLIGQPFASARYFHGRPSAAGAGYDALRSGASNAAPTSRGLYERVRDAVRDEASEGRGAPVDLVTMSGSGLDPDVTPAAALAQAPRVAAARGMTLANVRRIVMANVEPRQLGVLGEPRVNVLQLNIALDASRTE